MGKIGKSLRYWLRQHFTFWWRWQQFNTDLALPCMSSAWGLIQHFWQANKRISGWHVFLQSRILFSFHLSKSRPTSQRRRCIDGHWRPPGKWKCLLTTIFLRVFMMGIWANCKLAGTCILSWRTHLFHYRYLQLQLVWNPITTIARTKHSRSTLGCLSCVQKKARSFNQSSSFHVHPCWLPSLSDLFRQVSKKRFTTLPSFAQISCRLCYTSTHWFHCIRRIAWRSYGSLAHPDIYDALPRHWWASLFQILHQRRSGWLMLVLV